MVQDMRCETVSAKKVLPKLIIFVQRGPCPEAGSHVFFFSKEYNLNQSSIFFFFLERKEFKIHEQTNNMRQKEFLVSCLLKDNI